MFKETTSPLGKTAIFSAPFENGPAIPDELLNARDEGRVVFFCGAGVSLSKAGLPSFFQLAEAVLNDLGVPETAPVAKLLKEALESEGRVGVTGLISADRMFGLLERDFSRADIENSVAKQLVPNDQNADYLSAHQTLIKLATTQQRTRLITTNFDRLFEDADENLSTEVYPQLPSLEQCEELNGIVYLHGYVDKAYAKAESNGLILSSSDFGKAYLSDGWATKFIKEVVERYTVVFLGYSADDPPISYLLEALNKRDQSSYKLFAFQENCSNDAAIKWEHKGVRPILFGEKKYHELWETLEAWAKRAENPDEWFNSIVEMSRKGPRDLKPHERGQVAHIASIDKGSKRFLVTPYLGAEWLCVFDNKIRHFLQKNLWTGFEKYSDLDYYHEYRLDDDFDSSEEEHNGILRRVVPENSWNAFTLNSEDRKLLSDINYPYFSGQGGINLP